MTLQIVAEVSPGSPTSMEERFEGLALEFAAQAEEGAVGNCQVPMWNQAGTLALRGLQYFHAIETEAAGDPYGGVIFVGYTAEREIDRGTFRTGVSSLWNVALTEANVLLSWRVLTSFKRPVETDLQRVAALMALSEMSWLDDDTTYIDATGGVTMDAVDYSGQMVIDVLQDCALHSTRNYYLMHFDTNPITYHLWYGFSGNSTYSSAIRISNDLDDIDSSTTFASSYDTKLTRSPNKVYSGILGQADGFSLYEFKQQTYERHARRDVVERADNVKTQAQLSARLRRRLDAIDTERDTITTTIYVPAAQVNAAMHGMRIEIKETHFPGYSTFQWMRITQRSVRQFGIYEGELWYAVSLTLTGPSLEDLGEDTSTETSGIYALLSGASGPYPKPAGPIYWDKTGDETLLPALETQGPFEFVDAPTGGYAGIRVTDAGEVDVVMTASIIGVINGDNSPYTVTWRILLNGAEVASESVVASTEGLELFANWGPVVSVSGLTVANGDVLSGDLSCSPLMDFFRSPWGVNPGVNNNRLEITGGSF